MTVSRRPSPQTVTVLAALADEPGTSTPATSLPKPGQPSTINLTRRIEFHLLYPWHIT